MLVSSNYAINNPFDMEYGYQQKKYKPSVIENTIDKISISDAAIEAYARSTSLNAEENSADNALFDQFKKQFNSYRGKGIFEQTDDIHTAESSSNSTMPLDAHEQEDLDKVSKKSSELERKIKDLTEKLESILQSDIPDTEKEAMAGQIQKEISELQSQLTANKQIEKTLTNS